MAQVLKEYFISDIQEKLFSGNMFLTNSVSHDIYADGKTVHVPQAGGITDVEVDRSTFPGTVNDRTDTELTYDLKSFSTDPFRLPNIEKLQLSYDKRTSLLNQHINKLNQEMGTYGLINWGTDTSSRVVLTTGTASSSIAPPTSTLSPKGLKIADLADAAAVLDADDVPQNDRFIVMPSKMYWNFVNAEKDYLLSVDFAKNITPEEQAMGVVSKVMGFNIIARSVTPIFTDGASPSKKAYGAAAAVDDVYGAVFYQRDQVAKAMGGVNFFERQNDPTYYGDIYSAEVLFNTTQLRSDEKGVGCIVQNT